MTEIASINNGLNAAGVRAPLYWFFDKGFFEEYLGDKKGERIVNSGKDSKNQNRTRTRTNLRLDRNSKFLDQIALTTCYEARGSCIPDF